MRDRASRFRFTGCLAAIGVAGLLATGLIPSFALAQSGGDWPQYRGEPAHTGINSADTGISVANVATLGVAWRASVDGAFPIVAGGVVYIGGADGTLSAFSVGCANGGAACLPLWTAYVPGSIDQAPAIADGVIYIGSSIGLLYAFPADCGADGGICVALWTAEVPSPTSATVADGVVYVGSGVDVFAFAVGCGSGGQTCSPLWTGLVGAGVSTPTVANGVVYVGSSTGVYSFAVGCSSDGSTCPHLWTAPNTSGYDSLDLSPAVADGFVFVTTAFSNGQGAVHAFRVGCAGGAGVCVPVWNSTGDTAASVSVANGVVYAMDAQGNVKAFSESCATGGGSCDPVWQAPEIGTSFQPPAVANGIVFQSATIPDGSQLDAYAIGCSNGGGTCTPLWSGTWSYAYSLWAPVVADGMLYVVMDSMLYAFVPGGMPMATPAPSFWPTAQVTTNHQSPGSQPGGGGSIGQPTRSPGATSSQVTTPTPEAATVGASGPEASASPDLIGISATNSGSASTAPPALPPQQPGNAQGRLPMALLILLPLAVILVVGVGVALFAAHGGPRC